MRDDTKEEEWKITLSLFNNLENGGIVRMNLNVWKRSCFQEKRPTILLNCPESTFSATSGMWTKQSFTRARDCLQLLWHFFLAFALRFQWSHLPQKIVETECLARLLVKEAQAQTIRDLSANSLTSLLSCG